YLGVLACRQVEDELVNDRGADARGEVVAGTGGVADGRAELLVVPDGDVVEVAGVPAAVIDRVQRRVDGANRTFPQVGASLVCQGRDSGPLWRPGTSSPADEEDRA